MNASPAMRDDDRVDETAEPRRVPGIWSAAVQDPDVPEDPAAHADPDMPEHPAAHADPDMPEDPAAHADPDMPQDPAAHTGPSVLADPAAHAGPDVPEDRPVGDPDVLILASEQGALQPQSATEHQPTAAPEPTAMHESAAVPESAALPEPAIVSEPSGTLSSQPVGDAARPGAKLGEPPATDSAATDPDQRWREIQVMFVDDPLGSVERAADLASDLVGELISLLEERERSLRGAWQGTDADTEQLRTLLRTYRALVDQVADFSRLP